MTMTKKPPYISVLLKKTDYNGKITEIESKIRSITGWTILVALNTVENKIAAVSNLVKKKYIYIYIYDAKVSYIECKHFFIPDYKKFAKWINNRAR